jgi:hypothetical protein
MKKYKIEGNIDFFNELYNSLDIEEPTNDDDVCLISGTHLTNHFVTLKCGHKFNYAPLFNDIKNHKQKYNNMEGHVSHLKCDEIRCPYCRNKQEELLPYFEEIGLPQVHGVNFIDPNKKLYQSYSNTSHFKKCEYLTPNPNFDASGNNIIEQATTYSQLNCKFFTCLNNGFYQLNTIIEGYTGENKCLCYYHKKKTLKDHNNAIKMKAKEEAKKAKEEEKQAKIEAKKKAKEDEKQAKIEAKLKAKEEAKKMKPKTASENVVLGPQVVEVTYTECIEILKSGPNKGKQCGAKASNSNYCKRHTKKMDTQIISDPIPEI